jgi:hypothetical protein
MLSETWRKVRLNENLRPALNPAAIVLHPRPGEGIVGENRASNTYSVGNAGCTFASYDPGKSRKNSFGEGKTHISQFGTLSPFAWMHTNCIGRFPQVSDSLKWYQRWVPQVPNLGPGKARTRGTKLCCQRPSGAIARFAAFFEVRQLAVCSSSQPSTAHQRH